MTEELGKQVEFIRQFLPPELMNVIEKNGIHLDPLNVAERWLRRSYQDPGQGCREFISGRDMSAEAKTELEWGAKLSSIACAFPDQLAKLSTRLHLSPELFNAFTNSLVAGTTLTASHSMNRILSGREDEVILPHDAKLAGFFIRTPLRIWNHEGVSVDTIPAWKDRSDLLQHFVVGGNTFWVLRSNTSNGYECQVLFRGTSSEFHAVPEYGAHGQGTQVFSIPTYDPKTHTVMPEGSDTVPLLSLLHATCIADLRSHLFQCLEWLGANEIECQRVLFVGHSMGAALVQTLAYQMAQEEHPLWKKSFFRSYAPPMCSNASAVAELEHQVIQTGQKWKYMEMVNRDDVVNVLYRFGGAKGFEEALDSGSESVAAWLMDGLHWTASKAEMTTRVTEALRLYPELAAAIFVRGFMASQVTRTAEDRRAGFRPGMRKEEVVYAGLPQLRRTFGDTMGVWFCHRPIEWSTEYLGKSHSYYGEINFTVFWVMCREYENELYHRYHHRTLHYHPQDRVLIVPCMNERDRGQVKDWLKEYPAIPTDMSSWLTLWQR